MRIFNAKHNLLIIFLCTLLVIQPLVSMPPQEVHFEPYQTYTAIVCFISFCIGTILCAFINKYCMQQPVITPIEKPSSEVAAKKKPIFEFESINTDIQAIKIKQEKVSEIITEQKKTIDNLSTTNVWMQATLCALIHQSSLATEKGKELLTQVKSLHNANYEFVRAPIAVYWMNKYQEEKKLFEEHKKQTYQITANTLQ